MGRQEIFCRWNQTIYSRSRSAVLEVPKRVFEAHRLKLCTSWTERYRGVTRDLTRVTSTASFLAHDAAANPCQQRGRTFARKRALGRASNFCLQTCYVQRKSIDLEIYQISQLKSTSYKQKKICSTNHIRVVQEDRYHLNHKVMENNSFRRL